MRPRIAATIGESRRRLVIFSPAAMFEQPFYDSWQTHAGRAPGISGYRSKGWPGAGDTDLVAQNLLK